MRLVNKKAKRDYEVIESIEAGVALTGGEVKSLRLGQGSLLGSRAMIKNGELWLAGFSIPRYKFASEEDSYDPERLKKLLVKKKERLYLQAKSKGSGLTMIPLVVYNKRGLVKVEIGLVRGKKKHEKRELLKKRKEKLNLSRRLKSK